MEEGQIEFVQFLVLERELDWRVGDEFRSRIINKHLNIHRN
jgi:hypothetical protein